MRPPGPIAAVTPSRTIPRCGPRETSKKQPPQSTSHVSDSGARVGGARQQAASPISARHPPEAAARSSGRRAADPTHRVTRLLRPPDGRACLGTVVCEAPSTQRWYGTHGAPPAKTDLWHDDRRISQEKQAYTVPRTEGTARKQPGKKGFDPGSLTGNVVRVSGRAAWARWNGFGASRAIHLIGLRRDHAVSQLVSGRHRTGCPSDPSPTCVPHLDHGR